MPVIKHFTVDGLEGAAPYSIVLDEYVNVFCGMSDTEKKTVTRILHACLVGDASIVDEVRFRSASIDVYSEEENRVYRRSIAPPPAPRPGASSSAHPPSSARRAAPGRGAAGRFVFRHVYLPDSRVYSSERPNDPAPRPREDPSDEIRVETLKRSAANSLITLWREFDFDYQLKCGAVLAEARLDILNTVFSQKERRRNPVLRIDPGASRERMKLFLREFDLEDELVPLETFARELEENTRLKRVVRYSDRAMEALDALASPLEKLKAAAEKVLEGEKRADFTHMAVDITSGENGHIPLTALSPGELNALLLLVAAVSVGRGVLLIDYPELGLHVDFQRVLLDEMRRLNPAAQFIVATDSPAIFGERS